MSNVSYVPLLIILQSFKDKESKESWIEFYLSKNEVRVERL